MIVIYSIEQVNGTEFRIRHIYVEISQSHKKKNGIKLKT